jgi:hypothetical protein
MLYTYSWWTLQAIGISHATIKIAALSAGEFVDMIADDTLQ